MTTLIQGQFNDELKSRYLTYALSTIMSRALPDVRDGLKPVHRRLLYSMQLLRLDPSKGHKKCARVVGDVIGKYHPHGDQSVYDAMVRLAQEFSVRYPLVDGQGNFGSIDGDGAAAMRYTEARLTKVASCIMRDMDAGTVDYQDNYDESESEPIVMPGAFPNLLANGSSGIAVGLSTSIPPHNATELCAALMALLKTPSTRDETILNHIKGPDFPGGGVLIETKEAMSAAYASGKGSFRLRARWETEDMGRGGYQIVVTEMPYQVQKSKLVEKIADLMYQKKLPWLADVRDESAEEIRLVLEPKSRNVDANALMAAMFRLTDLEIRVSLNMHVITKSGRPALMSLKEALQAFLDHRREVLVRKSKWRLAKIAERLHILDAYKVVYLNLDEVIEIIKENDHPAPILMERFKIDDIQANAILDMRLRRLRKLEEMEIKTEYDGLVDEQSELQSILGSEDRQTEVLLEEVKDVKKEFGDARRTTVDHDEPAEVIPLEAQVEKEPVTVLLSAQGWIRGMKGHMDADAEAKYKEGDEEAFRVLCQSVDTLSFLTSQGRAFAISAAKLPAGRGFGEPLTLMVELQADEKIIELLNVEKGDKFLLASQKGLGFVVDGAGLQAQTKSGKQIMNCAKGDSLTFCRKVVGTQVAAIGATERMLTFPIDEVPELGRGKGVKLAALKGLDLVDICVFHEETGFGLINETGKRNQVFADYSLWAGKRAQVGKVLPHGFKNGAQFFVPDEPEGSEKKVEKEPVKTEEKPEEKKERVEELVAAITAPEKEISDEERQEQFDLLLGDDDD